MDEDYYTTVTLDVMAELTEHLAERLEYPWWLEPDPYELLELTTEEPEPVTPAEPDWFIEQWISYRDWCERTGAW